MTTINKAHPVVLYDALAWAFLRCTGMMAPGKDIAAGSYGGHSHDERRSTWVAWNAALGPSDLAALVSFAELYR